MRGMEDIIRDLQNADTKAEGDKLSSELGLLVATRRLRLEVAMKLSMFNLEAFNGALGQVYDDERKSVKTAIPPMKGVKSDIQKHGNNGTVNKD